MLDQYNNPIPNDLVLLNDVQVCALTVKECKAVNKLNWYCFEGNRNKYIFISFELSTLQNPDLASAFCDASSPDDINTLGRLVLIDSVLHRYNVEDDWYWA